MLVSWDMDFAVEYLRETYPYDIHSKVLIPSAGFPIIGTGPPALSAAPWRAVEARHKIVAAIMHFPDIPHWTLLCWVKGCEYGEHYDTLWTSPGAVQRRRPDRAPSTGEPDSSSPG